MANAFDVEATVSGDGTVLAFFNDRLAEVVEAVVVDVDDATLLVLFELFAVLVCVLDVELLEEEFTLAPVILASAFSSAVPPGIGASLTFNVQATCELSLLKWKARIWDALIAHPNNRATKRTMMMIMLVRPMPFFLVSAAAAAGRRVCAARTA